MRPRHTLRFRASHGGTPPQGGPCNPAAGPPIVIRDPYSGDQVIVVGSRWNLLYAFDRNGNLLWTVSLDAPALGSPAYHDGKLYVATYNSIYEVRQAKLLSSPLLPGGLR